MVKAFETKDAIANGADEVDMVINIGAAKEHNWDLVREDMKAVIDAARESSRYVKVKVIIETCLLTDEEKVKVCEIARELKADFVKTSSGFSTGGATAEDVALMKRTVGPTMEVKASTGVRTTEAVQKMVAAGATGSAPAPASRSSPAATTVRTAQPAPTAANPERKATR